MKNVVFVTQRLGGGGSERVLTLIANGMKRLGHNVSIITFSQGSKSYVNECKIVELRFTNDINQIAALRLAMKKLKPDTVIAFEYFVGIKTVFATRGLACKVIVSERNDPHKLDDHHLRKWIRNISYALADVLVCQTDDAKTYFSRKVQEKAIVIMNPVIDNLPTWGHDATSKTIINFCRLEKQKNIPLLLEAFERVHKLHPDFTLSIYGEGQEKENIEKLIILKKMQKVVSIFPFSENIHDIAAQCAMFVSSSDYEGLSNSMLEAMAIGMPVVCTDCPIGGARMVIEDDVNGLLVPVQNVDGLVMAINTLIENPAKAIRLGEKAYEIRNELTANAVIAKWEQLL